MVMAEITVSNSAPNVQNVSNCAPMRYRLKRKDIDPCGQKDIQVSKPEQDQIIDFKTF